MVSGEWMKIILSFLLLVTLTQLSFSQEQKILKCYKEANVCRYQPVHRTPQELQSLIIEILYNNILGDSYFRIDGSKTLFFWDKDAKRRETVKSLIVALDEPEVYQASYNIRVRAEFYIMRESSLRNIGAELTKLRVGRDIVEGITGAEVNNTNGGLGIGLNFPVAEVGGVIARERSLKKIEESEIIVKDVLSGQQIGASQQTNFYFAPTQTEAITEKAGFSISGQAKYDKVNDRVMIHNFDMTFGQLTDNKENISIVNGASRTVLLEKGLVYPTVSISSFKKIEEKQKGFLRFSTGSGQDNLKIVVYLSAEAIPYQGHQDNLIKENKAIGKEKLTNEEITTLPTTCMSDSEILNDIILTARRSEKYNPMLFFSLKKSHLCKSNYKKRLSISYKVKRNRVKNMNRSFQQLVFKPFVFSEVEALALSGEEVVSIKLTLETISQKVVKKLKFSPSTNKDISHDFWME